MLSGDIALAARQYWYATGDKEWLRSIGYPMTKGVAEFYVKRAVKRGDTRGYRVTTVGQQLENRSNSDSGDGDGVGRAAAAEQYDYNCVMGPDEYAYPVNNSAFTNAAATIALNFATEAAMALGLKPDPMWAEVAAGLSLLVEPTVPTRPDLKGGYHPEYEGFPKDPLHPKVKQADTIMLSYPLGVEMSPSLLANDLSFCECRLPSFPASCGAHQAVDRRSCLCISATPPLPASSSHDSGYAADDPITDPNGPAMVRGAS